MERRAITWMLVGLWAVLFAVSFIVAATLPPEGDGFTRGLNRVSAVLTWQGVALVVALVALFVGTSGETAKGQWIARAPFLVQFALALIVALGVAYRLVAQ
ncbi:MAG: hypothetical protein AB7P07_13045 [Hyphomonadaceae bacterium]